MLLNRNMFVPSREIGTVRFDMEEEGRSLCPHMPRKFLRRLGHLSKGRYLRLHVSPGNREALNQLLRAHFGGRPFSILDLGCGDAATLTPLLEGWRSSYTRAWTCRKPPWFWPRRI